MQKGYALEDLLGSSVKIKLVQFFVRNGDKRYSLPEIAAFLHEHSSKVRGALEMFSRIRFITSRKNSARTVYTANKNFHLFRELRALALKATPALFHFIKRTLEKQKEVKLVIASGVLLGLGEDSSRADLLIVGNRLSAAKMRALVAKMESEIGQEIKVATLSVEEFFYRKNMYDKFLRDIFDYRHETLIEKLRLD